MSLPYRSARTTASRGVVAAVLAAVVSLLLVAPGAQARPLPSGPSVAQPADEARSATARAARPAARRNHQVPRVGSCHALSARQLLSSYDTKRPVPCSSRHNLRTIAVKRLTRPIDYEDFGAALEAVGPACARAKARILGRNDLVRSQSAYDLNLFVPTPAQRRRGAAWVRCDLGIFAGKVVVPLREDLSLPAGDLPYSLTACLDARAVNKLSCTRPHGYRAVGALRLSGNRYPTPEQVRARARDCARFIEGRGFYRYPSEPLFRGGERALVCYQATRR